MPRLSSQAVLRQGQVAVCPLCNGYCPGERPGEIHTHAVGKNRKWNWAALLAAGEAQGWRCALCRFPLAMPGARVPPAGEATVEHLWPRALGGPNRRWNVVAAHAACNGRRGTALTARVRVLLVERIGEAATRCLEGRGDAGVGALRDEGEGA